VADDQDLWRPHLLLHLFRHFYGIN
jgi:hypothetical protein